MRQVSQQAARTPALNHCRFLIAIGARVLRSGEAAVPRAVIDWSYLVFCQVGFLDACDSATSLSRPIVRTLRCFRPRSNVIGISSRRDRHRRGRNLSYQQEGCGVRRTRSDVRSELQRNRQSRRAVRVLKKIGGWTFVLSRRGASPRTMRPRLGRAVLALAASCYEIRGGVARIKRRSSAEAEPLKRGDVEPSQQRAQRTASNDEDDALEDEGYIQRRSSAAPLGSTRPDASSAWEVQRAASHGALPAMFSRSNTKILAVVRTR
jgi:hypothetical protein